MAVVHKSRLIGEDPMEPVDSTNRGRQDGVFEVAEYDACQVIAQVI
jgi:hypothetical protein